MMRIKLVRVKTTNCNKCKKKKEKKRNKLNSDGELQKNVDSKENVEKQSLKQNPRSHKQSEW